MRKSVLNIAADDLGLRATIACTMVRASEQTVFLG